MSKIIGRNDKEISWEKEHFTNGVRYWLGLVCVEGRWEKGQSEEDCRSWRASNVHSVIFKDKDEAMEACLRMSILNGMISIVG